MLFRLKIRNFNKTATVRLAQTFHKKLWAYQRLIKGHSDPECESDVQELETTGTTKLWVLE